MARKHLLAAPLNRSSLVSVVEFSARKLIIFVLVQLVLSPFILITADSLSGSMNNNGTPALDSGQRFGVASNITVNRIKTECTGAVTFLTNTTAEMVVNVTAKSANGNSISEQSEIVANGGRPYDVNLSLTGNASINNQSEGRIMASDSERMNQQNGHFNKSNERVLSRKRRYLIFPPGSSIQIVYDTYHPIVDYTNYLILGITAAMAWELPSQPVYLNEELHDTYEMGELPLLNRIDKNEMNAQYVLPSKKYSANTMNSINSNSYYTNIPKRKFNYEKNQYQSPYKISYHKSDYKPSKPIQASQTLAAPTNKLQSYISYADGLMKQFKQLTENIPSNRPLSPNDFQAFANIIAKNVKKERKSNSKYAIQKNHYSHIIHPAFKKRSIDELTPLETFDLNLHRNSRHALYKQINTFLKTQGSDGNECILKMLCETGQRRHNREPGSMVMELLRTVFTLPEPLASAEKAEHQMYDEAHASIEDCQQQFPKCKESVWNSKYM